MPSILWGRAESVRTALRQVLQGFAPLVFGIVSGVFSGGSAGFGAGVDTATVHASPGAGHGLALAFVVLAVPLVAAGVILILVRHRYLRDVVAAGRSDEHRFEPGSDVGPAGPGAATCQGHGPSGGRSVTFP